MTVKWWWRLLRPRTGPSRRTKQRMAAVILAILRNTEKDDFTAAELAQMTGQGVGSLDVALQWMETLKLIASYWEEEDPSQPRRRLYCLTAKAYKWTAEAMDELKAND